MKNNELFNKVAANCSEFFPRIDVFKSCPESSAEPSCLNCRNYVNKRCVRQMFDSVASRLK